ncbi:alpha/beta hydrolase [Taibaiella soli]|nr:alpha/beta hydrolase-fold protein [Taibaiella soli]
MAVLRSVFLFSGMLFIFSSCQPRTVKQRGQSSDVSRDAYFSMYAPSVNDSFYISVALPEDYDPSKKYPVVYLLDANVYYNIIAATTKEYGTIGMLDPMIVVGIGYKDFPTLDSLRNRDYTYPAAMPEQEMAASGGAEKFLSFLNGQLIPYIDKHYPTNPQRTLAGHSLGGYFVMYALFQHLNGIDHSFTHYIAASPSLEYNQQYLLGRFDSLKTTATADSLTTYITYGGLEDKENAEDVNFVKTDSLLHHAEKTLARFPKLKTTTVTFSNMVHMDTPFPSFIKGLQD